MDYYLLTAEGKQSGPYQLSQLRSFWANGNITRETPHWSPGMKEWAPVGILEKLLTVGQNAPTVIPAATPPKKSSRIGLGCLLGMTIPVVCFAGLFLALYSLGSVAERAHPHTTKQDWRAKVLAIPQLNQGLGIHMLPWGYGPGSNHARYQFRKEDLLNAVGAPNRYSTSSDGDKYLYWDCSDGSIEFVCSDTAFEKYDTVAGNINDY